MRHGSAIQARLLPARLGLVGLGLAMPLILTGRAAPVMTTDAVGHDPITRARSIRAAPDASTATSTTTTTTTTTPGTATVVLAVTTGCAEALAYLASHQAPGFVDVCGPGTALGHYGFTCWNTPGHCPDGGRVIHIACPAPFVSMNEAHNSWSLQGRRSGIDPYGQGTPAEQQFCDRFR